MLLLELLTASKRLNDHTMSLYSDFLCLFRFLLYYSEKMLANNAFMAAKWFRGQVHLSALIPS